MLEAKFLVAAIKMYAVLDIETTGGKYNEEGITEIAIYRFNGHEITDQFSSLVNPERDIQPFVERLTGINAKMLVSAPKFFEVAKRIIEITEDCVLVAHNAEFDCRILQTEFRRLGYTYERKSLCTVTLSQELLPNQESYSLGKLVRSLGIPISDQHRAFGDAMATLKLFSLLLEKDSDKTIIKRELKDSPYSRISPKHLKLLDDLPTGTGIYYLYNRKQKVIYIGRSSNIKKQVQNHLTQTSKKNVALQQQLHQISYTLLGDELIALLKEQHEIKIHQPRFNSNGRHFLYPIGIRIATENELHSLRVEPIQKKKVYIARFKNKISANKQLKKWLNEFELCALDSETTPQGGCKNHEQKQCKGACVGQETVATHNLRIAELTKQWRYPHPHFLMLNKGRSVGEYSFLYFAEGEFRGYGYYELNHQIKTPTLISKRLIPIQENTDIKFIICNFIGRKKYLKIIPLEQS